MKTNRNTRLATVLLLLSTLNLQPTTVFAQGNLTPPGAPAPTMKSLTQIEPRIDLQNAPASAVTTTDPNYHFIITQPGSYYLSANLGVTKTHGVQINAAGVSFDLKGFEISRASGSGGNGIDIPATSHRASLRDGSISGFASGIVSLSVSNSYARDGRLLNLSVANCTSDGILSGQNWLLDHCVAHDCSGNNAISGGNGSTLLDCSASNNSGNNAINAGSGCVLTRCNAYKNTVGSYAIFASSATLHDCDASENAAVGGIYANSCSLLNCTANSNTRASGGSSGIVAYNSTLMGCDASNNTSGNPTPNYFAGAGITAAYSKITHCTFTSNHGDGMTVDFSSFVSENHCYNNGTGGGDGAGIHVTGQRNRIEGNNVSDNPRGIDIGAAGNLIIKNSAKLNTTNYNIVGSNRYGPIVDITAVGTAAVNGNSSASTVATTDPWANFAY
ncbi:MAG: hypothetical protein HY298_21190 [Verrucomicrobia bacterium]|nr:hypothetical protein [Verrucomicrobiota bacterium]